MAREAVALLGSLSGYPSCGPPALLRRGPSSGACGSEMFPKENIFVGRGGVVGSGLRLLPKLLTPARERRSPQKQPLGGERGPRGVRDR